MYIEKFLKRINTDDKVSVLAYEIGSEITKRKVINIYQEDSEFDEMDNDSLYISIETTKKLIKALEEAIQSLESNHVCNNRPRPNATK